MTHVGASDVTAVCPGCGERNIPETVRRLAQYRGQTLSITYFNCPECDFSTWDVSEWDWTPYPNASEADRLADQADWFAEERTYGL